MPSPKHPCAHPGCTTMVCRKEAVYCKPHVPKTPEWNAKNSAANRGRSFSVEHRKNIKLAAIRRGAAQRAVRLAAGWVSSKKPSHCSHSETVPAPPPVYLPIERTCPVCAKIFTVTRPNARQRFCSRECGYIQRRGDGARNYDPSLPTITCVICGTAFRLRAHSLLGKRECCSNRCRGILRMKRQKNSDTNIERAMAAALTAQGVIHESQVPLAAVCLADFYLPDIRTVVFCDGDYWHSLPEHVAKDRAQTAVLKAAGYRVCRFLGSAILADVTACVAAIIDSCTCGTSDT